MTSLAYLNLSNNALTSLDNSGMTSLKTLEIQDNLFTTFSGTWPLLTYLDISNNKLTSFEST